LTHKNYRIVAVLLPPTFALSIFLMAALTLFFGAWALKNRNFNGDPMNLGILLGWAWGSAAMAAGLAVRSQTLLAQQQHKLQSSLAHYQSTRLSY
jgi:hypothetical protein